MDHTECELTHCTLLLYHQSRQLSTHTLSPAGNGVHSIPIHPWVHSIPNPRWQRRPLDPFAHCPLLRTRSAPHALRSTHAPLPSYWWAMSARKRHRTPLLNHTRGSLVEIMYSQDVRVFDIVLKDSPFWTSHFYDCDRVHVRGIHVLAPRDSPNTDGVDPDSSRDVLIENSIVDNGDDCVAIKAGWDCFGVWYGKETANVHVRNLTCRGLDGVVIGSEMSGGVRNVTVEDVRFEGTSGGSPPIHIKTALSRSGRVVDVRYENITITGGAETAIRVDANYGSRNPSCPANWSAFAAKHPPVMARYSFVGVHAEHATLSKEPVHLVGLASSPIHDIFFDDVHVHVVSSKGGNGRGDGGGEGGEESASAGGAVSSHPSSSWVCENVGTNATATANVDPAPCDAVKPAATLLPTYGI